MLTILLAAYNGEKYITGQIESLLSQTYRDFRLYIRDDKSTDGTFSIISEFAADNPGMIFAETNETNTGEARFNFIKMLIDFKDDYIMLCDQDDVWLPDKIEKSLKMIKTLEDKHGRDTPLLVHTDLKVVNDDLDVISSSYEKMSNKDFRKTSLNSTVTMNNAAGCTIIYNRALGNLIRAKPGFIVMHDWWLTLTAAAFGKTGVISEPTVLYRQHDDNELGANRRTPSAHLLHKVFNFGEVKETLERTYRQADSFLILYKAMLTPNDMALITAYASIPHKRKMEKVRILFRYKTWKNGFIRKFAQILAV